MKANEILTSLAYNIDNYGIISAVLISEHSNSITFSFQYRDEDDTQLTDMICTIDKQYNISIVGEHTDIEFITELIYYTFTEFNF